LSLPVLPPSSTQELRCPSSTLLTRRMRDCRPLSEAEVRSPTQPDGRERVAGRRLEHAQQETANELLRCSVPRTEVSPRGAPDVRTSAPHGGSKLLLSPVAERPTATTSRCPMSSPDGRRRHR
jgi:hypothetical protein